MSPAIQSTGSDEFKVLGGYPGSHQVGLWQNITVTIWFGSATLPAAQELVQISNRLMVALPDVRISVIHIVPARLELPSSEMRAVFVGPLNAYPERFGCISVILGGTGFWTSAMRGFITGMRVLAPRTFDLRVHGDAESLLEWFPSEHWKRTGVQIDRDAFARVLAHAKATQAQELAAHGDSGGRSD